MPSFPEQGGMYRGPRTYGYPIIESPLSQHFRLGREGLAMIADIINRMRERKKEEFANILEGVKSGLVDPNQALVQGTRGGELYQKYFGAPPPMAPYEETVRGQRQIEVPSIGLEEGGMPGTLERPTAPAEAVKESVTIPTEKKVTRGGFQPRSPDALKQWIISQRMAGKEVDPKLELYAGLAPKTQAQMMFTNPEYTKQWEQMKQDPAIRREAARLRIAFPDASSEDILDYVRGSTATPGKPVPKTLGQSEVQKKRIAIGEYKNKQVDAQIAHWKTLEDQGDTKLSLEEEKQKAALSGRLFDIAARHVGPDMAGPIAEHLMSGAPLEEIPITEEVRNRIKADFSRKQKIADAKMLSAESLAQARKAKPDLDERRYQSSIEMFNAKMKYLESKTQNSAYNNWLKMNMQAIANRLKDPNTREDAGRQLIDFMQEHLSSEVGDYTTFQAAKEWIGNLFGAPGLGRPQINVAPGTSAPPQGNVAPQIRPIPPGGRKELAPKTSDEFLRKYGPKQPTQ